MKFKGQFQKLYSYSQKHSRMTKALASFLVLAIVSQYIILDPAILKANTDIFSENNQEDIVIILAEENLLSNNENYDGLREGVFDGLGLSERKIPDRINRYALDVQSKLHQTKVEIMRVKKTDSPEKIASLLKQAYFQNVSDFDGRKLSGVIIVGEVPLPVVDKAGNRFISMYPYTDFESPVYTYNQDTDFFEFQELGAPATFEPEVWHGVIDFSTLKEMFPDLTEEQVNAKYAEFFDKNHLYHQGNEDFSKFEKQIFLSEPVHEKESLNATAYENYQRYQDYAEELVYNRMSGKLNKVINPLADFPAEDLYGDEFNPSTTNLDTADTIVASSIKNGNQTAIDVFKSITGKQFESVLGTGRYTASSFFTPITAIARKDDFAAQYFKLINDLIETKVDTVAEDLQQDLIIPNGAILSGQILTTSGGIVNIDPISFVNNAPTANWIEDTFNAIGNIRKAQVRNGLTPFTNAIKLGLDPNFEILDVAFDRNYILNFNTWIFGTPVNEINSAEQCRIIRGGGTDNPLDNSVKTVRGLHTVPIDQDTVGEFCFEKTTDPANINFEANQITADVASFAPASKTFCSEFFAEDLKENYRAKVVADVKKGQLTHESCFNMRPLPLFDQVLNLKYPIDQPANVAAQNYNLSNQPARANEIIINSGTGLTLNEVLAELPEYDRPAEDWNAWSYFLLANPKKTEFVINNPENLPGIAQVTLNIEQLVRPEALTRKVKSIVKHKDPTPEIITAIQKGAVTQSLPINATRYTTFVDTQGKNVEIEYPNLFKAVSVAEFEQQLIQVESKLNSLSGTSEYTGLLTGILTNQDVFSAGFTGINQASKAKVAYLINWSKSDLNQKYASVYAQFLNSASPLNFLNFPTSFEVAIITAENIDNAIDTGIIPEDLLGLSTIDQLQGVQETTTEVSNLEDLFKDQDQSRRIDQQSIGSSERLQNSCSTSNEGIPVVQWFSDYLPCWLESVKTVGTTLAQSIKPKLPKVSEILAPPNAVVNSILLESDLLNYSSENHTQINVSVKLLDQNNKVLAGLPRIVDLEVSSNAEFSSSADKDLTKPGVQYFAVSPNQKVPLEIKAAGAVTLKATLKNPDSDQLITETKTFTVHQSLNLDFGLSQEATQVNSSDGINFTIKLLNQSNQAQEFLSPEVSINNPLLGGLQPLTETAESTTAEPKSEYQFKFIPANKSGQAIITVKYPDLSPVSKQVTVRPLAPKKIYFKQLKSVSKNLDITETEINLVDQYNNKVNTNLSDLAVTVSDSSKIELLAETVSIEAGVGKIRYRAKANSSGNAFIIVKKDGLEDGIHKVGFSNSISLARFNQYQSPALYYELKLNQKAKAPATNIISTGKAQAVSTYTTDLAGMSPSFYVHPTGVIEAVSQNKITIGIAELNNQLVSTITDQQNNQVAKVAVNLEGLEFKGIYSEALDTIADRGIYLVPAKDSLLIPNPDNPRQFVLNKNPIFEIKATGTIALLGEELKLEQSKDLNIYGLNVVQKGAVLATVYYKFNQADAITVTANLDNLSFAYKKGYTLSSSAAPKGTIFYNKSTKLLKSQLPQEGLTRSSSAFESANTNLNSGTKSILLFSAGLNAGEANKHYLSEIGILIGDPSIKLNQSPASTNGFNQDIGDLIAQTDGLTTRVIPYQESLVITDSKGFISRYDLQSQKFYKNLLQIPAGIKDLVTYKPNASDENLIVLTNKACTNVDSCLYLIDFSNGQAKSLPIEINFETKATQVFSFDHNNDGDTDLMILGEDNLLYLVQSTNQQLQPDPSTIGSIFSALQSDQSLKEQIWISADNSSAPVESVNLSVPITPREEVITETVVGGVSFNSDVLITKQDYEFKPILVDPNFAATSITLTDLNGELLRANDSVRYTVNLRSSTGLRNANLSIPIPTDHIVATSSLTSTPAATPAVRFLSTIQAGRPYIISGINAAANQNIQVSFTANYKPTSASSTPLISIIDNEGDLTPDRFQDVKIVLTGENKVIYYHSEVSSSGVFSYQRSEVELTPKILENPNEDFPTELPDTPTAQEDLIKKVQDQIGNQDTDSDGVPNNLDSLDGNIADGVNKFGDALQNILCQGAGCLPMPINIAFLVPRNGAPGLPVFAWGCGVPPFVWPPSPFPNCLGGSQYISPTLTGEFAGATCLGPNMLGMCFVYRLGDIGAACEAISTFAEDVINSATGLVSTATGGVVSVGAGGGGSGGGNVTVPGFPSIITDWVTAQIEEITTKLLDLPDLTIIYPSSESLVGYFRSTEENTAFDNVGYLGIEDALAKLAAMPLFDIQLEKQTINYPMIPEGAEFAKYLMQFEEILENNKQEFYTTLTSWACFGKGYFKSYGQFSASISEGRIIADLNGAVLDNPDLSPEEQQICLKFSVKFIELFASLDTNLDALKSYRDIPKNIFELENFVANYADQALSYAEVILDRTAGFLNENTLAIVEWQNFFIQIQTLIDDFLIIIDFILNFMTSCDDCRTDRTNFGIQTLIQLLLQAAGSIAQFPVIPFPKMPNITIDFSQIEAGINITLPQFEFVPDRINLPDLNMFLIDLPSAPPVSIGIDFGKYGFAEVLTLPPAPDLGTLILDLIDLPSLNIPEFPSIPRPPDIGMTLNDLLAAIEVPLKTVSAILRILCIIGKGFIPIPESMLASKIESMTNRGLTPVLPIDIGITVQYPEISYRYLEEYKIILETYFNFDFDIISTATNELVAEVNKLTNTVVTEVEKSLQGVVDLLPSGNIEVVPGGDDFEINANLDLQSFKTDLKNLPSQISDLQEIYDKIPKNLDLVASTTNLSLKEVQAYEAKNIGNAPDSIQKQYQKLVAYKKSFKNKTLVAEEDFVTPQTNNGPSTVQQFTNEPNLDLNIELQETANQATFSPESGIYYITAESQRAEKIVNYTAENYLPTTVNLLDFDNDDDQDVIYSRGTEVYFKQNQTETADLINPLTNRISIYNFEDFANVVDVNTVATSPLIVSTDNKKAVFILPKQLKNKVTIIDIYHASLNQTNKFNRYIVNGLGTDSAAAGFEEVDLFNQSERVNNDGFGKLFVRNSFSQNLAIELPNQNYRATISTITDGVISVLQNSLPITPNICKDKQAPNFGSDFSSEITEVLYNPVNLDFTEIKDSGTNIVDFYLDTNLSLDKDADGNSKNDRDLVGTGGVAFKYQLLGFVTPGNYRIAANAIDEASNASTFEMKIKIVSPTLDLEFDGDSLFGNIGTTRNDLSVEIIRERDGQPEIIAELDTENQEFEYSEYNNSPNLVVKDKDNNPLAEMNYETGSIKTLSTQAAIEILTTNAPGQPTQLKLLKGNEQITVITKQADANQDVKIATAKPANAAIKDLNQVLVFDEIPTDNITLTQIPGGDLAYPGGLKILQNSNELAIIDTNGGIKITDPSLQIKLQPLTDLRQYQWFELYSNTKKAISFIIPFGANEVQWQAPTVTTRTVPATTITSGFRDLSVTDSSFDEINYLQKLGVVEGILRNGQRYFEPSRLINRAEYAKIMLEILCIEPRPESYLKPNVFSDILFSQNLDWYYAITKETKLQKLFTGYQGELDKVSKLPPFKPTKSITLAEATKVVLEALQLTKVISLKDIKIEKNQVWYAPYIEAAQNLTPYINSGITPKQNYILTKAEANNPTKQIDREEFAIIAYRVLNIKNCKDPNGDILNGLTNKNSANGTVTQFDPNARKKVPNLAGLYIEQSACLTCPCNFRFEFTATYRKGDIIYAVLRDPITKKIIAKSILINI